MVSDNACIYLYVWLLYECLQHVLFFIPCMDHHVRVKVALSHAGRTMNVAAAVLDDFKALVRQHGMSDDTIIMNQNKGTNWRTGKAQV